MSMFNGSYPADPVLAQRIAELEEQIAALANVVEANKAVAGAALNSARTERAQGDDAVSAALVEESSGREASVQMVNDAVGDLVARMEDGDQLNRETLDLIALQLRQALGEAMSMPSWAMLAATDADRVPLGKAAKVYGPDPGTHVDPQSGETVDNEGIYYAVTGTGWVRLGNLEMADVAAIRDETEAVRERAIADVTEIKEYAESARDEAIAYSPSTYETTDPDAAAMIRDDEGRIFALIPDPDMARAATYETTDIAIAATMIDEGGRVAAELARAEDVREAAAQLAALARAPLAGIFETTDRADLVIIDDDGRQVASFPDPALVALEHSAAVASLYETTDVYTAALVRDPTGRVVSEVPSQLALDASRPATVQEVEAARGNTDSLSARVAAIVTADGAPIVDRYGRDTLRMTHMMLTKLSMPTPEACQAILNIGGDSFSHLPERWTGPLAAMLTDIYGDAGGGWCGFGYLPSGNVAPWTLANQPTFRQGNVRPDSYPTIHVGAGVGTYYTAASPDLALVTMSQAGNAIYQGFPSLPIHNGCDLFFVGTADGAVRWSWGTYNGSGSVSDPSNYTFGLEVPLNVQGGVGQLHIVDISSGVSDDAETTAVVMPSGAGMLRIVRSAGSTKLCGVNLKSDAPGVRINKLAATGSNIAQWANAPAGWETGLAALGATGWIYMDGTNSQSMAMAPALWGNRQEIIVNRVRAATPGIDVLIAAPPENLRPDNPVPMTAYAIEGRKRAMTLHTAFRDLQWKFGDPANPAQYADLFEGDLKHPKPPTDGRLLLAGFLDMILPF
ncbi:MAG: hypothetical protein AB7E60_01720 [Sphingobium sp.]